MPKANRNQNSISGLYQIESILNKRVSKKGICYLIKWRGYAESKATWEKEQGLGDISQFIQAYENRKHGKQVILKKDQLNMNSIQTPDFMTVDDFQPSQVMVKQEATEMRNNYADYYNTLPINLREGNQECEDDIDQRKSNRQFMEREAMNDSIDISFESKLIAKKFDNIVSRCEMPLMSPLPKKKQKELKQEIKGQRQTRGKKNTKSTTKTAKSSQALTEQTSNIFQVAAFEEYVQRGKSAKSIRKSAKCVSEVQKISTQALIPSQGKIEGDIRKNDELLSHPQSQANQIGSKIRKSYKLSKQLREQRSKGEVKEIRMIPRTSTKPSEFLVEYGSGELKVFQIIQLMIAHPLEMVKHLEEGKGTFFS